MAIGHCTLEPWAWAWGLQTRVPLCQNGDDVMKVGVPAGFCGADACVGLKQQHLAQQVQSSRAQIGRQVLQQMSCSQAELEAACVCAMHAASGSSERAPWLTWQGCTQPQSLFAPAGRPGMRAVRLYMLTGCHGFFSQSLPALDCGGRAHSLMHQAQGCDSWRAKDSKPGRGHCRCRAGRAAACRHTCSGRGCHFGKVSL